WQAAGLTAPLRGDFEAWWRRSLHDGIIPETQTREVQAPVNEAGLRDQGPGRGEGLEIVFRPDPTLFDGRFANNGWLQELPKPLTRLTWDNAAFLSPATAARLRFAPS